MERSKSSKRSKSPKRSSSKSSRKSPSISNSEKDAEKLLALPGDIRLEIMKELPYLTIKNLCEINKDFGAFCKTQKVKDLLEKKYPKSLKYRRQLVYNYIKREYPTLKTKLADYSNSVDITASKINYEELLNLVLNIRQHFKDIDMNVDRYESKIFVEFYFEKLSS